MGKKIEHTFIDGIEGKVCAKCGEWKPLSKFNNRKASKDGLQTYCKECKKQYMKQYCAEHADEIKQYHAELYTTIEYYTSCIRQSNLKNDRKYGRCAKNEDPLAPLEYYIEKLAEGIDYYDGKKHHFNELGFDRIDDNLPHTIGNIIVATTFHNKDRWYKRMTVDEYREYIQNEELFTSKC